MWQPLVYISESSKLSVLDLHHHRSSQALAQRLNCMSHQEHRPNSVPGEPIVGEYVSKARSQLGQSATTRAFRDVAGVADVELEYAMIALDLGLVCDVEVCRGSLACGVWTPAPQLELRCTQVRRRALLYSVYAN